MPRGLIRKQEVGNQYICECTCGTSEPALYDKAMVDLNEIVDCGCGEGRRVSEELVAKASRTYATFSDDFLKVLVEYRDIHNAKEFAEWSQWNGLKKGSKFIKDVLRWDTAPEIGLSNVVDLVAFNDEWLSGGVNRL